MTPIRWSFKTGSPASITVNMMKWTNVLTLRTDTTIAGRGTLVAKILIGMSVTGTIRTAKNSLKLYVKMMV